MKLVSNGVIKLAKTSRNNTLLHSFYKSLYYITTPRILYVCNYLEESNKTTGGYFTFMGDFHHQKLTPF